jgi:hypothetical protein
MMSAHTFVPQYISQWPTLYYLMDRSRLTVPSKNGVVDVQPKLFEMSKTPSTATWVSHFCPVLVQVRSLEVVRTQNPRRPGFGGRRA